MQQLKGGRMNRIAAEIAIEIRVLLQNDDVDSSAGEEKARHHSRRSAARQQGSDCGFCRTAFMDCHRDVRLI